MSTQPLIGAHVSAQGGIANAPARAVEIGCNAVQIFSDSPRIWSKRPVTEEMISGYTKSVKTAGILCTVIHSLYLVNLASDKPELVEKSITSLSKDMELAAGIGATGIVVHVGSHGGRGWDVVKDQVVKSIATILENTPEDSVFLIENSAGQGGKIGSDLREIRYMLDSLKAGKRVGVCIDSCHAFAAGYAFVPVAGEKMLFDWIEQLNLQSEIKVLHVNDSRDPYFSGRDRHENINDGTIGEENMKTFVTHPLFAGLPMILEVPGIEGTGPDKENVDRLKKLFE